MKCLVLNIQENLRNATFHQIKDIILDIQDEHRAPRIDGEGRCSKDSIGAQTIQNDCN